MIMSRVNTNPIFDPKDMGNSITSKEILNVAVIAVNMIKEPNENKDFSIAGYAQIVLSFRMWRPRKS